MKGFDYSRPGLFRLIINKQEHQFDFIFSCHHCIADGWSIASLVNEFIQAYSYQHAIQPYKHKLYFGQYIMKELAAVKDTKAHDFWKEYTQDMYLPEVNWHMSDSNSNTGLNQADILLDQNETKLLHQLAQKQKVTVDSLFLYAYMCTLKTFLNHHDITIGLAVNNRLEEAGGDEDRA